MLDFFPILFCSSENYPYLCTRIYKCKIRGQNYKKKMTYTSSMNKILVEHGLRMKIHMVGGYSRPTINEALAGRSETAIARKIRLYALRNGGVEVPSNN